MLVAAGKIFDRRLSVRGFDAQRLDVVIAQLILLGTRQCPPAYAREATEALAIHHEHRVRDLEKARTFALQSLRLQATVARQDAVQYRLARLDRKLGVPAQPLFQ